MIEARPFAGARKAQPPVAGWFALLGPAFVVSIGYMDPGNWATDLGAGAFGYRLLWVIMAANVLAIGLQVSVSNLAVGTGSDLATLIAQRWPRARLSFWAVFQLTAMATDLAEFAGVVLGAQLLFHLSLAVAVLVGITVVTAVFACTDRRSRLLEYLMMSCVALVALACVYQLPSLHPVWSSVLEGALVPSVPSPEALVLVAGIIGATVMPHNLFLHSALIVKHTHHSSSNERVRAGHFFQKETLIALNVAAAANALILIVGASVSRAGVSVASVFSALFAIRADSSIVFGAGLLVSGIAALISATLAGDYIFAAFSPVQFPAPFRRAVTILPSAAAIVFGLSIPSLLIWSQVALAIALPAVLIPLALLLIARRRAAGGDCRDEGGPRGSSLTV